MKQRLQLLNYWLSFKVYTYQPGPAYPDWWNLPAWTAALALVTGLVSALWWPWIAGAWVIPAVYLMKQSVGWRWKVAWLIGVLVWIVAGFWLAKQMQPSISRAVLTFPHQWYGVVEEVPEVRGRWQRVPIRLRYGIHEQDTFSVSLRILAYVDTAIAVQPGDGLIFYGRLFRPEVIEGFPPFDMRSWLASRDMWALAWIRKAKHVPDAARGLRIWSQRIRAHLMEVIARYVPDSSAIALLQALTLGYRAGLDPEVRTHFVQAGIIHVLAISGLHVGILYVLLVGLLGRWRYRAVVVLPALMLFALVTGLSASVLRATTMMGLIEIGQIWNRRAVSLNMLGASAVLMLIVFPYQILGPGFWMSYLAVLGILLVWSRFRDMFHVKPPWLQWLVDMWLVTLSAQVFVLPIQLALWHQMSLGGFIGNLIAIPLVALLLYGTLLLWTVSWWSWLSVWVGKGLAMMAGWLIQWSEWIARQGMYWQFSHEGLVWLAPIWLVLFMGIGWLRGHRAFWTMVGAWISALWIWWWFSSRPVNHSWFFWSTKGHTVWVCGQQVWHLEQVDSVQQQQLVHFYRSDVRLAGIIHQDTIVQCGPQHVLFWMRDTFPQAWKNWLDSVKFVTDSVQIYLHQQRYVPVDLLYSLHPAMTWVVGAHVPNSTRQFMRQAAYCYEVPYADLKQDPVFP